VDVDSLPGFESGAVSVQDEAAQLCAPLLQLAPHMNVLDACAAPGGKTAHLLETAPSIHLTAIEIDPDRSKKIAGNLERLKLQVAHLIVADVCETADWQQQTGNSLFDRILLDAPCSATGVIRRHPDIKLLRRPTDIRALTQQQLNLLSALWSVLKPNGVLLYATCSLLPQENDQVIEKFISTNTDASVDQINEIFGIATSCGRQLFPQEAGHDGFYFSRLVKASTG
jgi:16S rRNA (cytosine967-C5)-methyltransferase